MAISLLRNGGLGIRKQYPVKNIFAQPGVLVIAAAALTSLSFYDSAAHAQSAKAPVLVPKFHEETDTSGFQSRFEGEDEFMVGGGVAAFDCDNDGLPEVYVTAGVNKAKFYRNRSMRGGPIKLQGSAQDSS